MNFASFEFILIFAPIFFIVWRFVVLNKQHESQLITIILFSLLFYGYFVPSYVILIIGSISFNFFISKILTFNESSDRSYSKLVLYFGVIGNLILLGYFKYTNFFIEEINILIGSSISEKNIILPLAISFFTFQQIGFLLDVYYKKVQSFSFVKYFAFVTFFPQLIAGPIIKYKLMSREFNNAKVNTNKLNFAIGISVFIIGLAKKVIIADNLGFHADYFFDFVANGNSLYLFGSWVAALLFTVQIYFDFSGYCDMAFGLAKMTGITIPINFNSPYKAKNLIDFWQRWHITLSKFLNEYIHLPISISLARNRVNIFIIILFPVFFTFAISGIWHGAGRTFLIWGLMHGAGVSFNHLVKHFSKNKVNESSIILNVLKISLTFIFVIFTMVMFRSQSITDAMSIYKSMIGMNGISIPSAYLQTETIISKFFPFLSVNFDGFLKVTPTNSGNLSISEVLILLFVSLNIIFFLPNSYQITQGFCEKVTHEKITKPKYLLAGNNLATITALSTLAVISYLMMNTTIQFIYFQF